MIWIKFCHFNIGISELWFLLFIIECVRTISLEENGPRFTDEFHSPVQFSNGVGGKVFCRAQGQPTPSIQWYANQLSVGNISGIREVDLEGALQFHPFDTTAYQPAIHRTSYHCRASNQVGSIISPQIELRAVVDAPYELEVADVIVSRGNTAVLRCSIPSQVKDFVAVTSWVQDSTLNIYPNFQSEKYLLLPSGDLYVFNVDSSDGYKQFACHTTNKLTNEGKRSTSARIIVQDSDFSSSSPQPIKLNVAKQSVIRVREGEDVHLPCAASAGQPQYTWFREQEGQQIAINPSIINFNGPLHLSQVKKSDSGQYICLVNNSVSTETVRVQLEVYVPLHVQLRPQTQIVEIGRSATFHCSISGSPIQLIEWYKDGKPISNPLQSRYSINSSPETLTIVSVRAEDAGMYQCFISNDLHSTQDSAQLRLGSILPELIYRFTDQTLQPGPSVSLKCTAIGNPPPQFQWKLDGYSLPESERFMVGQYVTIHDNVISHLNITNVHSEDGGLVTCEAKNSMGVVAHSARLNIYGPPFVRPIPPIKAVASQSVQIQCPVSGFPIEAISWERGGKTLPLNRRQKVYSNGTLVIEHVHRDEDEGAYTCSARDRQGATARREFHLKVVVPPKILPFQFMSQLLKEGMRTAVSCQVMEGDKPFDFTWQFNGNSISGSTQQLNSVGILFPDEYSSTLVIESLDSTHTGEYACIVENSAGREIHTAQLTVNVPPKWTIEPKDINVSSGHSITLHCQASGYPAPIIHWRRATGINGGEYKELNLPTIEFYSNGSIKFHEIKKLHEGSYLCEAKNGIGTGLSKLIYLKVNAPPQFIDTPTTAGDHQTISARVQDNVKLQCRAAGDFPIEMQWSNKHNKITQQQQNTRFTIHEQRMEDSMLSELLINELTPDENGIYSCRASNVYGSGQISFILNVQEPPGQPINLRVIEQQSRSVHVSWSDTFNGNNPLLKFIVQYKFPLESWTHPSLHSLTIPPTQTHAKLTSLLPATTYYIRILAQNSIGFGQPSETIQVTTREEPPEGTPLNIQIEPLSSTKLKISWQPPAKALWHGTILGYYLGHKEIGALNELNEPTSGNMDMVDMELNGYHLRTVDVGIDFGGSALLDNLNKHTRYAIIIQAFNSQGHGPSSSPQFGLTLQDVPSQSPTSITCNPVTSQSIQLIWGDPPLESRHGIIQGYKIKSQLVAGEDDEDGSTPKESIKLVIGMKSAILHELQKWSNYSIQMLAFTSVGDGIWSKRATCTTEEDVPLPLTKLKALVSSRHSILVSWLPPQKPHGIIHNYTLYMKSTDSARIDKKHFQAYETSAVVANLKENSKYEFWMSASTRVGEGGASERVRVGMSSKVPARIASFSQSLLIPWKRELTLPCDTVGIPEPSLTWKFGNNRIENGPNRHINSMGTLTLSETSADDSGNCTCSTSNAHGTDSIVYSVRVQIPPRAPNVFVSEIAYENVLIEWNLNENGGAVVKGYLFHLKKSAGGDWEELEIESAKSKRLLEGLTCGTRYQFYITARNKIGTGLPSRVLEFETKGAVPIVPKKNELIFGNSTSITIRLENWAHDVGCPVFKYVVEYKREVGGGHDRSNGNWILVAEEVYGDSKTAHIKDLVPNTKYELRVTAENPAGKSLGNFHFVTSSTDGSMDFNGKDGDSDASTGGDNSLNTIFLIIFPAILSLIAILSVIALLCYFQKKRLSCIDPKSIIRDPMTYSESNPEPRYCPVKTNEPQPADEAHLYKGVGQSGGDYADDVCPYATFELPAKPPGRPMLISGGSSRRKKCHQQRHTGETLYNKGNIYSGPYQDVQAGHQYNEAATMEIRDYPPPKFSAQQFDTSDAAPPCTHGYDNEEQYQTTTLSRKHRSYQRNLAPETRQQYEQEMVTFREQPEPSEMSSAEPDDPNTSSPDSSPVQPRFRPSTHHNSSLYCSHKSKSKSSVVSGSSSAQQRLRNSSGYSSHAEETSFSFHDHIQPPSKFSDSRVDCDVSEDSEPSNLRTSEFTHLPNYDNSTAKMLSSDMNVPNSQEGSCARVESPGYHIRF